MSVTFKEIKILVLMGVFLNTSIMNARGCTEKLGLSNLEIPDWQMTATTWQPGRSDPWYGRLHNQTRKSWCATTLDTNQYLQIDFGPNQHTFTAVATQGSHNYDNWVAAYAIIHSVNGKNWTEYRVGGVTKVFTGNSDRSTTVKHSLDPSITAVYLRFNPRTWNNEMCMRVEVHGCATFSKPLGMESRSIPDAKIKSRSYYSTGHASKGRLNYGESARMYTSDQEFLEINIGTSLKTVTAIATQGHALYDEWVKSYSLSYTADGAEWYEYKEDGEVKFFSGNNDRSTIVKHKLRHNITALLIRFNIEMIHSRPGLRVEIYGDQVCTTSFGMENSQLPDTSITASRNSGVGYEARKARLKGSGAWCGVNATDGLYIDLGRVRRIHKVAVQGHPSVGKWVTKFKFHYSIDKVRWYFYEPTDAIQVHNGNTDQNTVVYLEMNKVRRAHYVMFQPISWNGAPCMRVDIYGCEECVDPIGVERQLVPDSALTATSNYDIDHEPWLGRLYGQRGEGAWCSKENDGNQYLQLDLGSMTRVTGVATQGKYRQSWWAIRDYAWVTGYMMSYSDYELEWTIYSEDGINPRVFSGNSEGHDVIRHTLGKVIVTWFLRFIPVTYHVWTCMRVEVYGCKVCDTALGMEEFHIHTQAISESTGLDSRHSNQRPRGARLNQDTLHGWYPRFEIENPYLQIDLGIERALVTAVACQGERNEQRGTYMYTLSFSYNQLDWFDYREEWQTKVLTASKARYTATKVYLKKKIQTRFIRFWPKQYVHYAVTRVEVYGCRDCSPLLTLLSPNIENTTRFFTGSSTRIVPWNGEPRINSAAANATWCGASGEFLRIDFGSVKHIRAIYIQGHPTEAKWMTKFNMDYSDDGMFFKEFRGYLNTKYFPANADSHTIANVSVDPKMAARYLHIHPHQWNGAACMRIAIYGDEDCKDAIGMETSIIDNKAVRASSWLTIDHNPSQSRLNNVEGGGAWCPRAVDEHQFLEVNVGHVHRVSRVATQGRYPVPGCRVIDAWVTNYTLAYSLDGFTWQNYTERGLTRMFAGNTDYTNTVTNTLKHPMKALLVRFRPVRWHTRMCMRVELYGCREYFKPLGLENYDVPNINFQRMTGRHAKYRLNDPIWPTFVFSNCLTAASDRYLHVNLGYVPLKMTGIAMQGRNQHDYFLTDYTLSFSMDGGEWFHYMEDGEKKILSGTMYNDPIGIVVKHFRYEVYGRHILIWPIGWRKTPCFRLEVYGYSVRNDPLGMASGGIADSSLTASSSRSGFEPSKARLILGSDKAWCAANSLDVSYISIDLGRVRIISQLATGSMSSGLGRVTSYRISSSVDGFVWKHYTDDSSDFKTFSVSQNNYEAVKHSLRFHIRAQYVLIYPVTWTNQGSGQPPCMTLELYGKEACVEPLGMEEWKIPKQNIKASSWISTNYMPWTGRLGTNEFGGAWCARYNNINQFLQIDVGQRSTVKYLVLQGKEKQSRLPSLPVAWVETFVLWYGNDGYSWTELKEHGSAKIFQANSNGFEKTMVPIAIGGELVARFFRVYPRAWHNHICMRVELIGCEACADALGMENYKIKDRAVDTSSFNGGTPPHHARLNRLLGSGYCAHVHQVDEYLQIDVGPEIKTVTGVAIQGRGHATDTKYITEFAITYSRDGIDYVSYLDNHGKDKIFEGSLGLSLVAKRRLKPSITARYVRIIVKYFYGLVCFRIELYGCKACRKSRGIGNGVIVNYTLTASSTEPGNELTKARLPAMDGAWCSTAGDSSPYIKADFNEIKIVGQIVTLGNPVTKAYVKSYNITYSEDGTTWRDYWEDDGTSANPEKTRIIRRDVRHEGHVKDLQFSIKARYIKLLLSTTGGRCMKIQFSGHDVCRKDIGMEDSRIPDSAISASSTLNNKFNPWNARLNRHYGNGAWCAAQNVSGQYLQVDLTVLHRIKTVAIQAMLKIAQDGKHTEAWVTKFVVKYSRDGARWTDYLEDGALKEFSGLTNKYETVKTQLKHDVIARFVRIVVLEWRNVVCLRMELYGCKACAEPFGFENYQIPASAFSASSTVNPHLAQNARLGYYKSEYWKPSQQNLDQYLQVDLGNDAGKVITALATQGRRALETKLQGYNLQYSDNGTHWIDYSENGEIKSFVGYNGPLDTVRHFLSENITSRYIRLRPKVWTKDLLVKMELYGCDVSP